MAFSKSLFLTIAAAIIGGGAATSIGERPIGAGLLDNIIDADVDISRDDIGGLSRLLSGLVEQHRDHLKRLGEEQGGDLLGEGQEEGGRRLGQGQQQGGDLLGVGQEAIGRLPGEAQDEGSHLLDQAQEHADDLREDANQEGDRLSALLRRVINSIIRPIEQIAQQQGADVEQRAQDIGRRIEEAIAQSGAVGREEQLLQRLRQADAREIIQAIIRLVLQALRQIQIGGRPGASIGDDGSIAIDGGAPSASIPGASVSGPRVPSARLSAEEARAELERQIAEYQARLDEAGADAGAQLRAGQAFIAAGQTAAERALRRLIVVIVALIRNLAGKLADSGVGQSTLVAIFLQIAVPAWCDYLNAAQI